MSTKARRPDFFAPEVVQTSMMDCGPAALKCVLEGLGVSVSYERLREACQTDIDGTSIDDLEEVAKSLGIDAEQTMVPADHLLLRSADILPAIVIVRLPHGSTHFVVVWKVVGNRVQIMDPGAGRRWVRAEEFLPSVFRHAMPIAASAWRRWAGSKSFLAALRERQRRLRAADEDLVARATADRGWKTLASLDAATRLVEVLVRSRAVARGEEARRLLRTSFETACAEVEGGVAETSIPATYWSAGPLSDQGRGSEVMLRGAVLIRVRASRHRSRPQAVQASVLSAGLSLALAEKPAAPLVEIARLLREDGFTTPLFVGAAIGVSALGAVTEAVLFRALFNTGRSLALWSQRLAAVGLVIAFIAMLVAVELPAFSKSLAMGRRLELRLRMAFLSKIPRLADRYFSSRTTADMTHRAHAIYQVRQLPLLAFRLLRSSAELLATLVGLIWLDRANAFAATLAVLVAVGVPLIAQRSLVEHDLRVRAHNGSLSQFYLDALLGLVPVRAHVADHAVRREHDSAMRNFCEAFFSFARRSVGVDAIEGLVGVVVAVGLLWHYLGRNEQPSGALLLVYWALNIPVIGSELAQSIRQYSPYRNLTLRLLEPLRAESVSSANELTAMPVADSPLTGVRIELSSVTVRAGGSSILSDIDLAVAGGTHVAVVGASGAGKSTLVGLLLGWHQPSRGAVLVDGSPLVGERVQRLRLETAWIDPGIQIWNRPLVDNLVYGSSTDATSLPWVIDEAELITVLERLPEGLASSLGEGGGLLSGGEGQRVRLARALLRDNTRLVILDEPFRGLDRAARQRLLARIRELWSDATILCITHDVTDTLAFARVLVVADGRIAEEGNPTLLAKSSDSRYAAMLAAERLVREDLWEGPDWRHLEVRDGALMSRSDP